MVRFIVISHRGVTHRPQILRTVITKTYVYIIIIVEELCRYAERTAVECRDTQILFETGSKYLHISHYTDVSLEVILSHR